MKVPISKNTVISIVLGFIFGLSVSLLKINKGSFFNPFHSHGHSHQDMEDKEGPQGDTEKYGVFQPLKEHMSAEQK